LSVKIYTDTGNNHGFLKILHEMWISLRKFHMGRGEEKTKIF